jgi:serine/threonine-protein kinase
LNVTDFGEADDGIVFLVMEYLNGRTLKRVIREEGPMPLARAVEIARQIAGALDAAHAEGVVHRDLKSDNIMLTESGGDDWAKVLDFGIAKIKEPDGHDPELTAPNLIIGTPQYMSPEQCSQAAEIDARSDIYSFGIILFEMLTGHVPFTGESATAIMLKQLQEPPPSVLAERKDLPPAVGLVIARALSKRPEDRQQSAGALVEAFELAASGKPVPAVTGENRAFNERDTNRIVVPTSPLDSRPTANEDYDEATVVHANAGGRTPTGEQQIFEDVIEPSPAARFNPWVVIVPAAAVLIAVLGIFYVVNSSGSNAPANATSNSPLAIDPNAIPAQPAQPATGANETNITSAQSPAPSPTSANAALPGADVSAPNANTRATPALVEETTGNRNANKRTDQPTDPSSGDNSSPSASPSSGSIPQRSPTPQATPKPSPKPTVRDTGDEPPPPTPRKTATPPPTKPGATQRVPADDPLPSAA